MLISTKSTIFISVVALSIFSLFIQSHAWGHHGRYNFVVREAHYTRLCETKKILTVNGQFPGPTVYARKGDTVIINVHNQATENVTIHWHGVKQPRNPWSDGPEYITQCPIQPGASFTQRVILSDEEGTLWWHAHSDWTRATVHGAIQIYPKHGSKYPFPTPYKDVPIILGEWWKQNVTQVLEEFIGSGGPPRVSDSFLINGQPGDLYPCSRQDTYKLNVEYGKTYLLRIINAAMSEIMFFAIAGHNLTAVGTDAAYTKPLTREYMVIAPGQTLDVLLNADQKPDHYYMAARAYSANPVVRFDNTTTTAILQYNDNQNSPRNLPYLPYYNDTNAAFSVLGAFRSLASEKHPISLPKEISNKLFFTVSNNAQPCPNNRCQGPNGTHLAASVNNISFTAPSFDILEAYYYHITGVYRTGFPSISPLMFNYTSDYVPLNFNAARRGTKVNVLRYNSTVELVFQGTNQIGGAIDHPMHLHGYSFYIVGYGFGNFDRNNDPLNYNLVDPPLRNIVVVPRNGWAAIRFKADNPGVWFMHCHLERHLSWGMNMVFIVRNGKHPESRILPRPSDMPPC
ncbi:Laccase [Heracleum sosnowskyi]|uniref:Laccase n=1 Tax=Heracleum sosnowskyi TaxID=360622 RepID=A0AAD8GXN2_9APIA|nr:Laccase [Heracleum sosnowskyi]